MNRFTLRTLPAFAALGSILALPGCGGGSSGADAPDSPDVPVAGLLQKTTAAGLEASIKAGFTVVPTSSANGALASSAAAPSNSDFTGTYTQEAAVDEFDAVRYDGEHLYVAPRRFVHCCFLAASSDGASNSGNPPDRSIRILATDPATAGASESSTIPLEDGISIQGMYTTDNDLFALTAASYYGSFGPMWADLSIWAPEKLGYRVYDTSDKSAPVLETDVSIDGMFVESRRIGNTVYIVSRFVPQIDNIVYTPQTAEQAASNQAILANVALDDMLPTITIDGNSQLLVDPANCYIANDSEIVGYQAITSITAVPIDNPTGFVNTCYNGDAYGVYVSASAIYLPHIIDYRLADGATTRIHKFALSGTTANYRGSADIRGQVWSGGQADFRMSEHNGDLRVLASEFLQGSADRIDHLLYVLRESGTGPDLDVVGQLPNTDRPEPIGKPNEQLYGVRFLGDRAFAVTFEQIDPLYAIDLNDPTDPFIAGELEVTGFSDFLHPVSDDLLLGLGSAAMGGIKLELFDVSDLSAPLSRGTVTLGEGGSYSEANYNRHAFTYQADVNGVDRFTIPVNLYRQAGGEGEYQLALHLFEIHDKATPELASMVPVGEIIPPTGEQFPWSDRNRAYLHDEAVYYVERDNIWSAFWTSPTLVNGPF